MSVWYQEKRQDVLLKIIFFIISPFLAFVYSLRRIKSKSSYIVFFLVSIFFGIAFSVDSGKNEQSRYDGQSYREKFESYQNISGAEFFDGLKSFVFFDGKNKDYYFDSLAFSVSRFTDNYHFLFMVVAVIFSCFALRSFRFLTSEDRFDSSISSYILAYAFISNQIFNINGFRFWTAAWIAVFCVFKIYRSGDKKYIFLALTTPFFHGSYWIFIGVLLMASLFKRFDRFWFAVFVFGFFVSNLAVETIVYFEDYLPVVISRMVESYTSLDYIKERSEWSGFGWVELVFSKLSTAYLAIMIFLICKNSKAIKDNPKTKNIYLFLMVWVAVFNFFMFIPSLGGRYMVLVYPFVAYIWLVSFKGRRYDAFLLCFPFVYSWQFFVYVRYYIDVTSWDFYFLSPVLLVSKYLVFN